GNNSVVRTENTGAQPVQAGGETDDVVRFIVVELGLVRGLDPGICVHGLSQALRALCFQTGQPNLTSQPGTLSCPPFVQAVAWSPVSCGYFGVSESPEEVPRSRRPIHGPRYSRAQRTLATMAARRESTARSGSVGRSITSSARSSSSTFLAIKVWPAVDMCIRSASQ